MSPDAVLNYIASEPGEWTVLAIADDLGVSRETIQTRVAWLRADGLVAPAACDVMPLRSLFPGVPDRVRPVQAFRVWEAVRRLTAPTTRRAVSVAARVNMTAVSRCLGSWRRLGAVSEYGSLWPSTADRRWGSADPVPPPTLSPDAASERRRDGVGVGLRTPTHAAAGNPGRDGAGARRGFGLSETTHD